MGSSSRHRQSLLPRRPASSSSPSYRHPTMYGLRYFGNLRYTHEYSRSSRSYCCLVMSLFGFCWFFFCCTFLLVLLRILTVISIAEVPLFCCKRSAFVFFCCGSFVLRTSKTVPNNIRIIIYTYFGNLRNTHEYSRSSLSYCCLDIVLLLFFFCCGFLLSYFEYNKYSKSRYCTSFFFVTIVRLFLFCPSYYFGDTNITEAYLILCSLSFCPYSLLFSFFY